MTDLFDADDDLTLPRGHRLDARPGDQIEPPRVDPVSIGELTDPGDGDVSAYGGSAAAIRGMSVAAQHPVQFASNLYDAAAAGVQKFVDNAARHIISGTGNLVLGGGDSSDPDEGGSSEGDGEGGESGGGDSGGGDSGGGESGGGEASSGEGGFIGGLLIADAPDDAELLAPDDAIGDGD